MIKQILFTITILFLTTPSFSAEAQCSWVDSEIFSGMKNSSKSVKKSKGWIYCKNSSLGSVVLEKRSLPREDWVKKTLKELYPNIESQNEIKNKNYSFANRVVKQIHTQNETFDVVFFFLKNKHKHFVFYAELLERPYKGDLKLATEEVEKILKSKPDIFRH